MKKIHFLFIMLFSTVGLMYAQEAVEVAGPEELDTTFSAVKAFFLPFITGQFLLIFAEAKKHLVSADRDWGIFVKTNIVPFLITTVGGVALYFALAYVPFIEPFVEILAGEDLGMLSAATLGGAAVMIVKGLSQSKS